MFTKFCAALSKISLVLAVIGLLLVVLCVQWQVIGRYIFNDTPTWADIGTYLRRSSYSNCPAHGSYTINPAKTEPTFS